MYPGVTIDGQGPGPAAGPGLALRPEDRGAGELRPHRDYGVTREGPTVYTECSTIWNPIHTDIRVAHGSGLPDIVVHGTETMARAVTAVLDDQDLGRWTVGRLATRFTGMVVPGETVTVHRTDPRPDPAGHVTAFRSTRSDGATVLQGSVELVPRG